MDRKEFAVVFLGFRRYFRHRFLGPLAAGTVEGDLRIHHVQRSFDGEAGADSFQ